MGTQVNKESLALLGKELGQGIAATAATSIVDYNTTKIAGWTSAGGVTGTDFLNNAKQLNALSGRTLNNFVNGGKVVANLVTAGKNNELVGQAAEAAKATDALIDAGINVAKNYLNNKVERLKNLWNTKEEITIGALMGEVSPFAKDPTKAFKALGQKCQDLITYLLGFNIQTDSDTTWSNYGRNLLDAAAEDITSEYATDQGVNDSLNQLTSIPLIANSITIVTTTIDTVKTIMKIIDTLKPTFEFISDMALAYWSGGTSGLHASEVITEIAEKIIIDCLKVALGIIRKYIYSLTIEMPALVVQSTKVLSVKEAVKLSNWGDENPLFNFLFSNDFGDASKAISKWQSWMQTVSVNNRNKNFMFYAQTYMAVAEDALNQFLTENSDRTSNVYWYNVLSRNPSYDQLNTFFNSSDAGNRYLKLFLNDFTQTFMAKAVRNARIVAGTMNYNYPASEDYKTYDPGPDASAGAARKKRTPAQQLVAMMASADIDWTEESLRTISKQVYDNL